MRDWKREFESRVRFVKSCLADANVKAVVYGNSGGKDCCLVSVICKAACANTLGVIMPCGSKRNYTSDMEDALLIAKQFDIEQITVDLTAAREKIMENIEKSVAIVPAAAANIAPRLRMTTLYTVAQSKGALVAGTGNASEKYMGYFTKWGDGAYDFNPIADLTVTEIYEFLDYLKIPRHIATKAPSAGLYEGQTDEGEMGVTYAQIDAYIAGKRSEVEQKNKEIIERYHKATEHKRNLPKDYKE